MAANVVTFQTSEETLSIRNLPQVIPNFRPFRSIILLSLVAILQFEWYYMLADSIPHNNHFWQYIVLHVLADSVPNSKFYEYPKWSPMCIFFKIVKNFVYMHFTPGDPKFSSVLLYLERFPRSKNEILRNFTNFQNGRH